MAHFNTSCLYIRSQRVATNTLMITPWCATTGTHLERLISSAASSAYLRKLMQTQHLAVLAETTACEAKPIGARHEPQPLPVQTHALSVRPGYVPNGRTTLSSVKSSSQTQQAVVRTQCRSLDPSERQDNSESYKLRSAGCERVMTTSHIRLTSDAGADRTDESKRR
jgi:hypothetical protein